MTRIVILPLALALFIGGFPFWIGDATKPWSDASTSQELDQAEINARVKEVVEQAGTYRYQWFSVRDEVWELTAIGEVKLGKPHCELPALPVPLPVCAFQVESLQAP